MDDRKVRVVLAQFDAGDDVASAYGMPAMASRVAAAWRQPPAAVTADGDAPPVTAIAIHPSRHWSEAQALLTAAETDRAARLRDFRDRQTYVFAHAVLRLLLGHELDAQARAIEFSAGAHGKPRLDRPARPVHFSLSYRRGAVAVATGDAALGVDIEVVRPGIDMLGIGRRFFAEDEQAFLEAAPAGELAQRFFSLWTRKEALVKAAGVGIDFMPAAGALKCRATLADEYGTVNAYCVHQLASTGNHAMALAIELSHPPA